MESRDPFDSSRPSAASSGEPASTSSANVPPPGPDASRPIDAGHRLPPPPPALERFLREVGRTADRVLDELDPLGDRIAEVLRIRRRPEPPPPSTPAE